MLLAQEHVPLRDADRAVRSAPFHLLAMSANGVTYQIQVVGLQLRFAIAIPPEIGDPTLACRDVTELIKSLAPKRTRPWFECVPAVGRGLFGYRNAFGPDRAMVEVRSPSYYFLRDVVKRLQDGGTIPWDSLGGKGTDAKSSLFDTDIEPLTQLMVATRLRPMTWFALDPRRDVPRIEPRDGLAMRRIDGCHHSRIAPLPPDAPENVDLAPLRILSYDIEAAAANGVFPVPQHHPVIAIAAAVRTIAPAASASPSASDPTGRICFAYGPSGIRGASGPVLRFETEGDMMIAWHRFLISYDPDVLTGWNTPGFDWPYLHERAIQLGLPACNHIGRFSAGRELRVWTKEIGTMGMKEHHAAVAGRIIYDMMDWCRKYKKFTSYTLNHVSTMLLKETKNDMHHSHIHPMWAVEGRKGDAGRLRISLYCVQDAWLPLRIMMHQNAIFASAELARLTGVGLGEIVGRGQEIMTLTNMLHELHGTGLRLPDRAMRVMGPYQGGHVFEPKRGMHDGFIVLLDYQSLYPSIIRAHNVSYDSIVVAAAADDAPPAEEHWRSPETGANGEVYYFIRSSVHEGVLSRMQTKLLRARREAKRLMELEQDPVRKEVLNARQLSIKITCNAMYGFTTSITSRLTYLPVGATITGYAREYLMRTAAFVNRRWGPEGASVVYGDSVSADTPILVRTASGLDYVRIDSMGADGTWADAGDKEVLVPRGGLQCWSDRGWTAVERVIRHRTRKPMFRVVTHTGCIDVTEDHSLLDAHGEKVSPVRVAVGDRLLHADLPDAEPVRPCALKGDLAHAWALGMFMAEGYCDELMVGPRGYFQPTWRIYNLDLDLLVRAKDGLGGRYPGIAFTIRGPYTAGCYHLSAGGPAEHMRPFVFNYRLAFYEPIDRGKRVPPEILNASLEERAAFVRGYYSGDGSKTGTGKQFASKWKLASAGLHYMAASVGFLVSVNPRRPMESDTYVHTICTGEKPESRQKRPPDVVKKVIPLGPCAGYVYDLETENHHFSAGIGRLVVHNTDSVMVLDPTVGDVPSAWARGLEMAHAVGKELPLPPEMALEMEGVKHPAVFIAKKRYGSFQYVRNAKTGAFDGKIDSKGLETVRRDVCPIASRLLGLALKVPP